MDQVLPYLPFILDGFKLTVLIAALAIIAEMAFGVLFTVMRRSRWLIARMAGTVLVEFFRGTSEVVQMFWVFFSLPILIAIQVPPITAAVLVLGINGGAYASEVMRGGLSGVPVVQREACTALGFDRWTSLRRVIVPQALRVMLPSLANVAINTAKATSVVSLVTVADLSFQTQTVRISTGESLASYLIALVLYLLLTTAIGLVFEFVERRISPERRAHKRKIALS